MVALDRNGWDAPTPTVAQTDRLRSVDEFYCPFRVEDGWASAEDDIMGPGEGIWVDRDTLEPTFDLGDWEIVCGYSCDHTWIMHESQFVGGALAADLLANDGIYCLVTVDVEPEDWEHVDEDTCTGWAVLVYTGGPQ